MGLASLRYGQEVGGTGRGGRREEVSQRVRRALFNKSVPARLKSSRDVHTPSRLRAQQRSQTS